jgi:4-hydroxy-3-methylbut-2-enyl diphosphate reductase
MGVASHLIDDETGIDPAWLDGVETVGITSGASAPESLVTRVVEHFQALGTQLVESHELVDEDVHFSLPVELRRAAAR